MAACCLTGGGPMGFGAFAGPPASSIENSRNPCEEAGVAAERADGLPSGLLLAIGRVESGRWDSTAGRVIAWPWAINAAGRGQWFGTKDAAAQAVRTLLDGGTRSIDVGCFQINLMWHPTAFANLEQAFDPVANANYAARFLLGLFSQTGSWAAAVEAYHSADPTLGFAYRQQVFATWSAAPPILAEARTPMLAVASRPSPVPMPMVIAGVRIWTPMPAGTAGEVVAMPGAPVPDPSQVPTVVSAAPLPTVSYRVMPAGLIPGKVTPHR